MMDGKAPTGAAAGAAAGGPAARAPAAASAARRGLTTPNESKVAALPRPLRVTVVGKTGGGKSSTIAKLIHPQKHLSEEDRKSFNIEDHDAAAVKTQPFELPCGIEMLDTQGLYDGRGAAEAKAAIKALSERLRRGVYVMLLVINCAERALDAVQEDIILSLAQSCKEDGDALTPAFWDRFIVVFTRARSLKVPRGTTPYATRWEQSRAEHEKIFRRNLATSIAERAEPRVPENEAIGMANLVRVIFVENQEEIETESGDIIPWTDNDGWNTLPNGSRCHEVLFQEICAHLVKCGAPIQAKQEIKTLEAKIASMGAVTAENAATIKQLQVELEAARNKPPQIVYVNHGGGGGGGCCMVPHTPVLMADGRVVPVESVRAGDALVSGLTGRPNKVLFVSTTHRAGYPTIGLLGTAPFLTADHPVMVMGRGQEITRAALDWEDARVRRQELLAPLCAPGHLLRLKTADGFVHVEPRALTFGEVGSENDGLVYDLVTEDHTLIVRPCGLPDGTGIAIFDEFPQLDEAPLLANMVGHLVTAISKWSTSDIVAHREFLLEWATVVCQMRMTGWTAASHSGKETHHHHVDAKLYGRLCTVFDSSQLLKDVALDLWRALLPLFRKHSTGVTVDRATQLQDHLVSAILERAADEQ